MVLPKVTGGNSNSKCVTARIQNEAKQVNTEFTKNNEYDYVSKYVWRCWQSHGVLSQVFQWGFMSST